MPLVTGLGQAAGTGWPAEDRGGGGNSRKVRKEMRSPASALARCAPACAPPHGPTSPACGGPGNVAEPRAGPGQAAESGTEAWTEAWWEEASRKGHEPGGLGPGGLSYEKAAGDWGADTRQRWTGPGAAGRP